KQPERDQARAWMCQNFFDIRAFGAVMTTDINCGQVRGPVQISFARSVDRIISAEHAVTRMAVTTEKEAEKQSGDNRTMGRKFTVPYALYRAHGFINPFLAQQTGFSDEDRELLFRALRSEEHTSELQSRENLVCRLLLEKKNGGRDVSGFSAHAGRGQLHYGCRV